MLLTLHFAVPNYIYTKGNIMENTLKREDFVRLRINQIEKERLLKIEKLTGRKRSDLVREAMYRFIKTEYPEFLN